MDQTTRTSRKTRDGGLVAVSLFSGAMGLDLGLERAGFQTRVAVESDPDAAATVRANRPDVHVFERPIEKVGTAEILEKAEVGVGELDLVAGGPACQSFSTAGKRRSLGDALGRLFYQFMRVVDEARPRFFLMENVRGLLSAAVRHRPLAERGAGHPPLAPDEELGSAFEEMTTRLEESGYYVVFDVLNAADFGVAQTRQRLVIIGSRDGVRLSMPTPTHDAGPAPGLPPWKTLEKALRGLHEDEPEYIAFVPSRREYFRDVPAGGNWRDLPEKARADALGSAGDSWGGRTGFFRRLSWDAPSPTLNTSPDYKATALCHPGEVRPLSVGEYARVQGFPDDWAVNGSTRAKYRQLGNAVPVELAAALGHAVRDASGRRRSPSRCGRVECPNLDLLNSLSARHRTRFNPPRMRGEETREAMAEWRGGKGPLKDDATRYTPARLSGAVGKKKKVACQAGLSKSESRHTLAKAVFAHSQGRIHDRSHAAQQRRVMALNLVIAAIVYWNTCYMDKAVHYLRRQGRLPDPSLLKYVSPLGWDHIGLTGDYNWHSATAERMNARPLNLYATRIPA